MGSQINFIDYYLPKKIVSNEELQTQFPDRDISKMANKIGVYKRHVVDKEETALDLAEKSCNNLFKTYDKDKIDFVILCTQSPDYYLPTSACLLQQRLGLSKNVGAFDVNQGCSGFIYGLTIAKGLISASIAKNVLLVMSETYSKHINSSDLGNRMIFGDASSAIVVEHGESEKIGNFVIGTDGEGADNLIVRNGGMKCRFDINAETIVSRNMDEQTNNDLYMNGSEIFYFVGKQIPQVVENTLLKNNLAKKDIDYYIFHQANEYMIDFLAKKLKLNKNQFYNNIEDIGNTVSSTIPIALLRSISEGLVKQGDKVMLCGFGVGYSWGAVIIEI
ncbi:3-oxoacyl-ACP synthase III family protein [Galbibacter pacificus]|uniref:Ketoacyl-ACP synthase III n=1 Tax=Galbibacter pacificus TaxID=2996052 RepID=A0ABT6FNE4_9FLAO|nr:ketoacyl-ACP synthase III [Galbibacter pacificus]MDG3581300.1 ketoacyl-ACP synthase III [Galbibacter pacificus]MDG3584778.1 ketoacyl-ACP synthase III [Galbibacter pacificus]